LPTESTATGVFPARTRARNSASQSSGFLNRKSREQSPPSPRRKIVTRPHRRAPLRGLLEAGKAALTRSTQVRILPPELQKVVIGPSSLTTSTGHGSGTGRRSLVGGAGTTATRKGAGSAPSPRGARSSPEERRRRPERTSAGGPPSLVCLVSPPAVDAGLSRQDEAGSTPARGAKVLPDTRVVAESGLLIRWVTIPRRWFESGSGSRGVERVRYLKGHKQQA
jgi:hypothetical protein